MKAIRFHQFGGPEVLTLDEVPTPEPGPGEVLVRVRACSINHRDVWIRGGQPRGIQPPYVLGSDVAGEVAAIGSGVDRLTPGQQVLLSPNQSCGRCPACRSGQDGLCPDYTILDGGYAEYITCLEKNVHAHPAHLSFAEAAAIPLVFITAWHMLVGRAAIQPGETVLVWGAGSGVGSAAIQIAKLHGCQVLAVAGTDEKLQKAAELGADGFINYKTEAVDEKALALTGGRGVEVVFEHVGEAAWKASLRAVKAGGRLVHCGTTTGDRVNLNLRVLFGKQLSILGSRMGSDAEFQRVLAHVDRGSLRPVVDRTFPLAAAAEAHATMERSGHFGKLILLTGD